MRGTSEPPPDETLSVMMNHREEQQRRREGGADDVSSTTTTTTTTNRRQLFDRHWSTSNLTGSNTAVRGFGRPTTTANGRGYSVGHQTTPSRNFDFLNSLADIQQFHRSWANTNGTDLFFGGNNDRHRTSTTTDGREGDRSDAVHAPSSRAVLLQPLEIPPMPRRTSASSCPRVDSSSIIHDAARITDWDEVLQLCRTHPEYAKYTGADGWTALHHACNRRCPRHEVVEALIEAYPDALATEEEKGWLPLHYACRFKAPKEVVHLLLHLYPTMGQAAVAKKDRQGRTPLYYAIRYDAPPGVVGLLLAVNPAAVLEADQHDESPLALVWDNWAEKLEARRIIHSFLPGGFPEPEGTTEQQRTEMLRRRLERQSKLLKRWRQVNVLLKAAFGFPIQEASWDAVDLQQESIDAETDRKWRIVHATASIKCHLSLFLLACALHPEQARELDENDLRFASDPMLSGLSTHQTALHLAAASSVGGEAGKTVIHRLLSLYREAAHIQDAIDGSLPFHYMVENKEKLNWANHAAILYHVYPRAVRVPDHQGRLSLHRACAAITHQDRDEEYFETSVIINVVRNYPAAAGHADNAGCLPFHHLAMHATCWDDEVEAVYNAHRNGAQTRTGVALLNRLALHLVASRSETQVGLVTRLLQIHPRGASLTDSSGKLPLHLAVEAGKEWNDGLCALHEAYPEGIRQAEDNPRGWLPLHMVSANSQSSTELLAKVVQLYPAGTMVSDGSGNFPLHIACENGKLWTTGLKHLFDAGPGVLSIANDKGLLPFHILVLKYCDGGTNNNRYDDNNQCSELSHLECLFELLRADPTVIV